jgi:hypothetical protein
MSFRFLKLTPAAERRRNAPAAHTLGDAGTVMPVNRLGLALEHALLRRLAHGASAPDAYTEQMALATIKEAIA